MNVWIIFADDGKKATFHSCWTSAALAARVAERMNKKARLSFYYVQEVPVEVDTRRYSA